MSKTGFKKGRLGIGTDNPRYPLDVVGDIRLTGGFRDASGNDFNFLAINNQDILKTPDIAGITCVNSKVGIFNVNPSEELDVTGNINFTGSLKQNGVEFGGGVFNGVQDISGSNISIYISGDDTTHANATGQGNVSLGTGCLTSVTSGQENIAIGKNSLNSLTTTFYNVAIGIDALESCTSNYNIGIGYLVGRYITSGENNIAIGMRAMDRQDVGDSNVAIGEESLYYFNNGSENIALGKRALYGNSTYNSAGSDNIGIGSHAGQAIKNGNKNICIGYNAGPTNDMIDYHERLYIGKSRDGVNSFIYGHMDSTNPILAFNAKVGIGKDSPGEHLDVSGNINFTGTLKQNGTAFGGGKFEDSATAGKIYYNGGNIGIGNTNPEYLLDLSDSSKVDDYPTAGEFIRFHCANSAGTSSGGLIWKTNYGGSYTKISAKIEAICEGDGFRQGLAFFTGNFPDNTGPDPPLKTTDATERMRIDMDGNVGIGTDSPYAPLYIVGPEQVGNEPIQPYNTSSFNKSVIAGFTTTNPSSAGGNNFGLIFGALRSTGAGYLQSQSTNYEVYYNLLLNPNGGNVGIGTTSPSYKLHVNGTIGIGVRTDYGAPILQHTSYVSEDYFSIGFSDGTSSGTQNAGKALNVLRKGNVGIGTTSPDAKLEIYKTVATSKTNTTPTNPTCLIYGDYPGEILWIGHPNQTQGIQLGYNTIKKWSTDGGATNDSLYFNISGSTDMTIDMDGNVGIGTTSPSSVVTSNNRPILDIAGNGAYGTGRIMFSDADSASEARNWFVGPYRSSDAQFQITPSTAKGGGTPDLNKTFCIEYTGNVGIGTTNPADRLHLGAPGGTSSNSYALRIGAWNNSTNGFKFYQAATTAHLRIDYMDGQTISKEIMTLKYTGNVGIGTVSPGYPLEVNGGVSFGTQTARYLHQQGANVGSPSSYTGYTIGIYANNGIRTDMHLWATSDERIKTNIIDVPDDLALQQVRDIPCRYYNYIDTTKRGSEKKIGFIAQEVRKILPTAINIVKDMIPNEMRILENISWEEIIDGSNNTYKLTNDLHNVNGVKYRFYVSNDPSGNDEVMKEIVGNSDNTFTFEEKWNNVFCYGKEVDDFHTIDKQSLFALNFSATQELDRQQQADKARITELEQEVNELKTIVHALKNHLGLA